jgi:5-methylcytosine-specific restriction endonuclease McrA
MICEYCEKEHNGSYGSGRFCSKHCAKGFSSKEKRELINEKISYKLKRIPDRFCSKCKINKIKHNNKSGICKKCRPPAKTRSEIITRHRQKRKEFLVEYKGGKCEKCGETRPWILVFHHINPKEKVFGLATRGTTKSIERDIQEVNKCILLCSNCHGDFEYHNHWEKITIEDYLKGL